MDAVNADGTETARFTVLPLNGFVAPRRGVLTAVGDDWFWEGPPLPTLAELVSQSGVGPDTKCLSLFVCVGDASEREIASWLAELDGAASAMSWRIRAHSDATGRWRLVCYAPGCKWPAAAGPRGVAAGTDTLTRAEHATYEQSVAAGVRDALEGHDLHYPGGSAGVLWELARRQLPVEHASGGAGSFHWFCVEGPPR
jgi:hypothetical protein